MYDLIERRDVKREYCKHFCHPGVFCPDGYCKEVNDVFDSISPTDIPMLVCSILINVGQHDNKFKLGEIIKYSPSEVQEILKRYFEKGDKDGTA